MSEKVVKYSERIAKRLLTWIRKGETLNKACAKPDMPNPLEVYDWLRNQDLVLGERSFSAAYQEAMEDRALSWQDSALELVDDVQILGRKDDLGKLRKADAKASLLLRLSKEQRDAMKSVKGGAGIPSAPTVVITRYAIDLESMEEPEGE